MFPILIVFCPIIFNSVLTEAGGNILPSDYKKCTLKSPDFDECFKNTITVILQTITKGIPSLDIPRLDPASVDRAELKATKGSPVGLELHFSNITFKGFAKANITSVKGTDLENSILAFEAVLPEASSASNYDMNGKLLMLTLRGRGNSNITLYDTILRCKWTGEKVAKDGKTYFQIKKTDMNITVKKGFIQMTNVLGGNVALEKQMNKVLNDNFGLLFAEFKQTVEDTFINIMEPNVAKFTENVPLEDLFNL